MLSKVGLTHTLLFNKFCVLPNHLLVITNDYVFQHESLSKSDFDAAATVYSLLNGDDWLFFYNSGPQSGATQPHRHLQLVPGKSPPIVSSDRKGNHHLTIFSGLIHRFIPITSSEQWYANYQACLSIMPPNCDSYSLLFTKEWMLFVPRKCEFANNLSFNSLAMGGYLLARTIDELEMLKLADFSNLYGQLCYTW